MLLRGVDQPWPLDAALTLQTAAQQAGLLEDEGS